MKDFVDSGLPMVGI